MFYKGSRAALIAMEMDKKTYVKAQRLFTIVNYSRFVRPGYKLVTTQSSSTAGVYLSAFHDLQSRQHVVVAINENMSPAVLAFPARVRTAVCYRTSVTEDLARIGDLQAADGRFTAQLAPQSVTTFVMA